MDQTLSKIAAGFGPTIDALKVSRITRASYDVEVGNEN
jgi:hypothetical protein